MTSNGDPEKLRSAKVIIRNSLIGLTLVIGAAALTSILGHAYGPSAGPGQQPMPVLQSIKPNAGSLSLVQVIIKAIVGVLQNVIDSIGVPFLNALSSFTTSTPLMGSNPDVFNLWVIVLTIADTLFVLVVAALGFHLMSASTFGINEIEFKHMIPQLGLIFVLMNSSIFVIDSIIGLSNGMIDAIRAGFGGLSVWQSLISVTQQSGALGFAALLVMVAFIIIAVILLIYYVGRLITLFLGAALSPLVLLLWMLPSFKDFATSAIRSYITTVFVLFVHVIILELAASLFSTIASSGTNNTHDPLMSLIVGLATLIALLKTQGVMNQLTYVSIGPKAMRKLGSQFANGISHVSSFVSETSKAIS